jgi:hypothetical protein
MAKAPTPENIAAQLTVPERVLLFCLVSETDWAQAGVTHAAVRHMIVRNLVDRDAASSAVPSQIVILVPPTWPNRLG